MSQLTTSSPDILTEQLPSAKLDLLQHPDSWEPKSLASFENVGLGYVIILKKTVSPHLIKPEWQET